jgi:AcrR family transcriptional regulator
MTRREKLRQEMLADIKTAARQQMAENGTAAISLSAIARALEVSQPALYRYYASRDDLVTALIVDAFDALAVALAEAQQGLPTEAYSRRLMAVILRYREWALEHPVDFQLIYGNPIPGYQAPYEVTAPSSWRSFVVILNILDQAYTGGALQPPASYIQAVEKLNLRLPLIDDEQGVALPAVVLYIGMTGWYRIHGMIMLELFHHVQAMLPEPGAFYRHEVEELMRSAGFAL